MPRRSRASGSDQARAYRQAGHDDARQFALSIGLPSDYQNDPHAKKDVIDPSGDAHSVKSGQKKWQIFLYGLGRFQTDDAWGTLNGVGDLLAECINQFPADFDTYEQDKQAAKERLRGPMRQIAQLLQDRRRLRSFLNKSMFNGGEVDYLTVKQDNVFHVFLGKDVIRVFGENLEVCNSTARTTGQTPEQKVLFRYHGSNLGELEMRNDSPTHYREVRFNMVKPKAMELLFAEIPLTGTLNHMVRIYGSASKRFGRW